MDTTTAKYNPIFTATKHLSQHRTQYYVNKNNQTHDVVMQIKQRKTIPCQKYKAKLGYLQQKVTLGFNPKVETTFEQSNINQKQSRNPDKQTERYQL